MFSPTYTKLFGQTYWSNHYVQACHSGCEPWLQIALPKRQIKIGKKLGFACLAANWENSFIACVAANLFSNSVFDLLVSVEKPCWVLGSNDGDCKVPNLISAPLWLPYQVPFFSGGEFRRLILEQSNQGFYCGQGRLSTTAKCNQM